MKRSTLTLFCLLVLVATSSLVFQSCQPAETPMVTVSERLVLPDEPYEYQQEIPAHISWNGNIPYTNLGSQNDVVTLGRVLFFDRKLSFNNTTSCSSCHLPQLGFSDGQQFSTGMQTIETSRNAPGIANLAFENEFFWDGRRNTLEDMALDPVQNHIEMGLSDLAATVSKLSAFEEYPELFAKAYGTPEVTEVGIRNALANFLRSLVSTQSRFDQQMQGENVFNALELQGQQLFDMNCRTCHDGGSLSGWGWANIGLDEEYQDQGVGAWNGAETSNGAFAIPGLRNVAVTAPYMHDGRFETLEQVIDHYSENIVLHDNLDYRLVDFSAVNPNWDDFGFPFFGNGDWGELGVTARRMQFTDHEKRALIAFLETLTDEQMMNDPRFQNPWVLEQ